jgi:hypothetical protein
MSATAYSCRPAVAGASDRFTLKLDAGRYCRSADGLQPELSLSAKGGEPRLEPAIPPVATSAQPTFRGVQQPLTHPQLACRVGVAAGHAAHPVGG